MPTSVPQDIERSTDSQPVDNKIFSDRVRTNILRSGEQALILFFVKRLPAIITPDILTLTGAIGSFIVLFAFVSASYLHSAFLLVGLIGLFVNWFGDSLDGRLAYYRNISRKWYGFALDIIMDWVSIITTGFGYYIYASEGFKWLGFFFVALYGWSMLIALLRYKITDKYRIDSGLVGPTELRIIIALILITETIFQGAIHYSAIFISVTLFAINSIDTLHLLRAGDRRDLEEKHFSEN